MVGLCFFLTLKNIQLTVRTIDKLWNQILLNRGLWASSILIILKQLDDIWMRMASDYDRFIVLNYVFLFSLYSSAPVMMQNLVFRTWNLWRTSRTIGRNLLIRNIFKCPTELDDSVSMCFIFSLLFRFSIWLILLDGSISNLLLEIFSWKFVCSDNVFIGAMKF